MSTRTLPLAAALSLLAASCGGGPWGYEPDVESLPPDEAEQTYPVGPYGSDVGQVLEDITFYTAFYDPMTMCKAPTDWTFGAPQKLSLSDLHQGNPYCQGHDKKRLLLVTTTPT